MDLARPKPLAVLGAVAIFLALVAALAANWVLTRPPSLAVEFQLLEDQYREIEADLDLLKDSFQPLMMAANGASLHQMEGMAKRREREWSTYTYEHPTVSKAHFELRQALNDFASAYGYGYIDTLTGRNPANDTVAIDMAIEAIGRLTEFQKYRLELLTLMD